MSIWTTLIVTVAVMLDFGAGIPRIPLPVTAAIPIATLPLLRRILRSPHEQHLALLPVSRGEQFAIDCAAVMLFLLPPNVLIVVITRSPWPLALLGPAAVVATMLLGESRMGERHSPLLGSFTPTRAYELRWLFRMHAAALVIANVVAVLMVAGAELAIRNNEVVRLHSLARIACAFATVGAAVLAAEIVRARELARPWRTLEVSLPISSAARLRSLLVASFVTAAPFLAALAFVRPIALPFAIAALGTFVLIGPTRNLWFVAGALTVIAALDARVAFAAAALALPWLWRKADVECGDFSRRSDSRRSRGVQRNPGKEHGRHS